MPLSSLLTSSTALLTPCNRTSKILCPASSAGKARSCRDKPRGCTRWAASPSNSCHLNFAQNSTPMPLLMCTWESTPRAALICSDLSSTSNSLCPWRPPSWNTCFRSVSTRHKTALPASCGERSHSSWKVILVLACSAQPPPRMELVCPQSRPWISRLSKPSMAKPNNKTLVHLPALLPLLLPACRHP